MHSKLDYCSFLYYGLLKYQINRLQHIQNALALTVVQAPKFQHVTPILKSLHWLKVSERIEYKIISLTKFSIPLSHCISSILPAHGHNTHSSPYVTQIKPSSSHKVTIFQHASPHLYNHLPTLLRNRHPNYSSPSQWPSFEHASLTCYTAITFHHFFTISLWAQNLPFQKTLSSTLVCFCLSDWSHGSRPFTRFMCSSVLCFSSIFSVSGIPTCSRLMLGFHLHVSVPPVQYRRCPLQKYVRITFIRKNSVAYVKNKCSPFP